MTRIEGPAVRCNWWLREFGEGGSRGHTCRSDHGYGDQNGALIKQSARQIGVDINLTVETTSKYYGKAVFGQSDWLDGEMSLVDYGARAVPNLFLEAPLQSINAKTGQGSWNAAHFSNPTYDKLSREFVAAPDLATQRRLAGQIERLLLGPVS